MANEIAKVTETKEEIITVTLDKKLVKKFDTAYAKAGSSMRDMCVIAFQITNDDKDAQELFRKHVVNDLGMSKATASKLISTGAIYNNYPDTHCLSHTKCSELLPVRDKVDEFLDSIEMDATELDTLSQKAIREKVKNFINPVEETEETSQDTEETTQDTQETAQDDSTEETTETVEVDEKDVRISLLEERIKYYDRLVKTALLTLKVVAKDELTDGNKKSVDALIKDFSKAQIKDLGL